MDDFEKKVAALRQHHEELLSRKNEPMEWGNGIYEKYKSCGNATFLTATMP